MRNNNHCLQRIKVNPKAITKPLNPFARDLILSANDTKTADCRQRVGCKDSPSGKHKDDLVHSQKHKVKVSSPLKSADIKISEIDFLEDLLAFAKSESEVYFRCARIISALEGRLSKLKEVEK